ncbi:hypothetical protein FD754_023695 [Muntiacus muntjak]|uniref:G-protein coupled receptors family 1 profile domain-containing protein n=1 Tax=Muntiacus muntjak TaxID=9888 RepID=A0A5N3USR8_MUNMU|nr:hypothetical protein FD754_023695 [Muntiacus muntjak]
MFILLSFSEYPGLQVPFFLVFLPVYMVTVVGNLGMIIIIKINSKLHMIMYFSLSHLSFVDFCFSAVVTPKLLENLIVEDRTISFSGCIVQFCCTCLFGVAETFMLAAYDHFVAVCNPLLNAPVMSLKYLCSITLTYFLLALSYCKFSTINNFICDNSVIVSISCSDPCISQILCSIIAIFNEAMPSANARWKTFSTCASYLAAISIFHGTILFPYCIPNPKTSWLTVKVSSVFYTIVIPMLNPLIYSLRNKEVNNTFTRLVFTKSLCHAT